MDYRSLLRAAVQQRNDDTGDRPDESVEEGNDDAGEYRPPSEAELKVLKARRDRSDRIAKRMGEYLLKGWKMLSSSCPDCDSILMEAPLAAGEGSGSTYCIGCRELESDVGKDDPAMSADAARSQAREAAAAAQASSAAATAAATATAGVASSNTRNDNGADRRVVGDLRSAALDRLDFYRRELLLSSEPADTERLVTTLERLLALLERLSKMQQLP